HRRCNPRSSVRGFESRSSRRRARRARRGRTQRARCMSMGVLVDEFGGKLAGELIRASDWNGMLAGIEALVGQLEANIEARLAPLEASLTSIVERLDGLDQQVAGIAQLTDVLRQRHRHVTLTA